ncbi:polyprenyl synthetase family protein [Ktedonosporobacter rubrisoli]|uniref:Polyprenyl synthetase family protein n=1 Tax=Ktedonosporobacter rubrisoli TaxID=2509675 RepID=A0A4P6JS23_KTERU|nr:polyprenyl synthetase family protein [Ktedonosporobacter rubrisoli]QBD78307.1 polyprenyl synthetase family protein [Ktedonosporobacter rubrisoli]
MIIPSNIEPTLKRYQQEIHTALQAAIASVEEQANVAELATFYGPMKYHLGWVDANFQPLKSNPGKLIRPTLLLLAYEAAGAWGTTGTTQASTDLSYLQRALPAAAAVELTHNYTLIHDDIEDGDVERRHRPTVWKIWGMPQAINFGDGMISLARFTLWKMLNQGVDADVAVRLAASYDRMCLVLSEGQHMDMAFEQRQDVSVDQYIDMISRKTAALIAFAAEAGARLGTRRQETIERLYDFGQALGIAFQVRDDLLSIWATSTESGKTPAGDIYRRKKSLPILHSLEHANAQDRQKLHHIYQQEAALTPKQVQDVLDIFERTRTKEYCSTFLTRQCQLAHLALANVPRYNSSISMSALDHMKALIHFLEKAATD